MEYKVSDSKNKTGTLWVVPVLLFCFRLILALNGYGLGVNCDFIGISCEIYLHKSSIGTILSYLPLRSG